MQCGAFELAAEGTLDVATIGIGFAERKIQVHLIVEWECNSLLRQFFECREARIVGGSPRDLTPRVIEACLVRREFDCLCHGGKFSS